MTYIPNKSRREQLGFNPWDASNPEELAYVLMQLVLQYLPAEPDFCDIQYITNIVTAAEKFQLACLTDATNVTVINNGNTTSPDYRVMSIVFHSIMR